MVVLHMRCKNTTPFDSLPSKLLNAPNTAETTFALSKCTINASNTCETPSLPIDSCPVGSAAKFCNAKHAAV